MHARAMARRPSAALDLFAIAVAVFLTVGGIAIALHVSCAPPVGSR